MAAVLPTTVAVLIGCIYDVRRDLAFVQNKDTLTKHDYAAIDGLNAEMRRLSDDAIAMASAAGIDITAAVRAARTGINPEAIAAE